MKITLHMRWASAVTVLIIVIVTIITFSLIHNFEKDLQQLTQINEQAISKQLMDQLKLHGKELSYQLSERLTNPLYYYDLPNLQHILSTIQGLDHVSNVYVFDTQGHMIQNGTHNTLKFEKAVLTPLQLNEVLKGEYVEQHLANQQNLFIQPIHIGNSVIGGVSLVLSFSQTQKNINGIKQISHTAANKDIMHFSHGALNITFLMVLIGFALAVVVTHRYTRPIVRLVKFAQAIGNEKNYQLPPDMARNDELGDLAQALNQIASSQKERTREIEHLAYHDSLTALPNRTRFTIMLDSAVAIALQNGYKLAVLCIDLDGFKRINDTLGHNTGNILIKAVSERIDNSIRKSHFFLNQQLENHDWLLARLGGDEFSIFLQNLPSTIEASQLAQCIMDALMPTFVIDEHELMVSASIGITTYPENGKDAECLLRNANIAMHRVKSEGKRDFKFFSEAMDCSANHKMSLESDLGNALSQQQLELLYQPIIHTQTGRIIGAEALIRWQSTRHSMVSPREFIPIAEERGLIHEIGRWVITTALQQLSQWNQLFDSNFHLNINISGSQLQKNNLADIFVSEISALDINPQNIHLEVTETSLIFNKQASIRTIDKLKKLGIKLWLDDFGTGYSSLSHLKQFNVDGVKIDRSFVSDLEDNTEDRALTFAIIAMAEALGLNVVAEGVETVAQWHLLSQYQELYLQGFLISEALKSQEFEHFAFKQNNVHDFGRINTVQQES